MQNLEIKGSYVTINIKSEFSKTLSKEQLVLIAASMLKAYTMTDLKEQLAKFDVKGVKY
jgi:hypothetical protein